MLNKPKQTNQSVDGRAEETSEMRRSTWHNDKTTTTIVASWIYLAHNWFVLIFVYGQRGTVHPSVGTQVTQSNERWPKIAYHDHICLSSVCSLPWVMSSKEPGGHDGISTAWTWLPLPELNRFDLKNPENRKHVNQREIHLKPNSSIAEH